jgi:hypothetical protein
MKRTAIILGLLLSALIPASASVRDLREAEYSGAYSTIKTRGIAWQPLP